MFILNTIIVIFAMFLRLISLPLIVARFHLGEQWKKFCSHQLGNWEPWISHYLEQKFSGEKKCKLYLKTYYYAWFFCLMKDI